MLKKLRSLFGSKTRDNDAKVAATESLAPHLRRLGDALEQKFSHVRVQGAWERRVVTSVLTRGGEPWSLTITLVAPNGDTQSAIVIGEVRADMGKASLASFSHLSRSHEDGLKGRLDLERESYDDVIEGILLFFASERVPAARSP